LLELFGFGVGIDECVATTGTPLVAVFEDRLEFVFAEGRACVPSMSRLSATFSFLGSSRFVVGFGRVADIARGGLLELEEFLLALARAASNSA